MIEMRKLKELVKLMVANDLSELDLQGEGERVTLKRGGGQPPVQPAPAPVVGQVPARHPEASEPVSAVGGTEEGLVAITSPMVGTFYTAPSPDAKPFVSVGDSVDPDAVVCIVEAMKVFNEIKADIAGTIEKILVQNGQAVEFSQPMMLVKPQ